MAKLKHPHNYTLEPRTISEDGKYWYGKCDRCGSIGGAPIEEGEFEQIYLQLVKAGHAW